MRIVLVFLRKNTRIHKKRAKFMSFSFWPFLWFGLPGHPPKWTLRTHPHPLKIPLPTCPSSPRASSLQHSEGSFLSPNPNTLRSLQKAGSVPTTPDPNTSAKASRYKWEPYRDTNWWCIYYFLPRGGHAFAKVSR